MHPVINTDDCIGCGVCAVADADSCIGCGACMESCPNGAITDIADD